MQLIASLIEAESGTAGVAGVETQTTPASRFRWPAVAADPIQRPCARAVSIAHTEIPSEIAALLEERQTAKKEKNFKRADEIRAELKAKGWLLEDTPKGPRLKAV